MKGTVDGISCFLIALRFSIIPPVYFYFRIGSRLCAGASSPQQMS